MANVKECPLITQDPLYQRVAKLTGKVKAEQDQKAIDELAFKLRESLEVMADLYTAIPQYKRTGERNNKFYGIVLSSLVVLEAYNC